METQRRKCGTAGRERNKKRWEMRKDGTYAEKLGWNMKMNMVREGRRMRHIRQQIEIERTEGRIQRGNHEKARQKASH